MISTSVVRGVVSNARRAIGRLVVANDDRLAAAEGQTCERRLVSHAARQTQRIGECFGFALVIPEACAADGWTKRSAVNGNDAVVTALGIACDENLLVIRVG